MPFDLEDSITHQNLLSKVYRLERERDTFVDHIARLTQELNDLKATTVPGIVRSHRTIDNWHK